MHLGSVAYNEILLKILGISVQQYMMIVKKYGIIQNLHPNSHIKYNELNTRFMIDALLNQFGRRKDDYFGGLDIITFDEIVLPLTIGRHTFQAKPNDVILCIFLRMVTRKHFFFFNAYSTPKPFSPWKLKGIPLRVEPNGQDLYWTIKSLQFTRYKYQYIFRWGNTTISLTENEHLYSIII